MTGDTQSSPVILAAGGTGGHMFPAEALAASFWRAASASCW